MCNEDGANRSGVRTRRTRQSKLRAEKILKVGRGLKNPGLVDNGEIGWLDGVLTLIENRNLCSISSSINKNMSRGLKKAFKFKNNQLVQIAIEDRPTSKSVER